VASPRTPCAVVVFVNLGLRARGDLDEISVPVPVTLASPPRASRKGDPS